MTSQTGQRDSPYVSIGSGFILKREFLNGLKVARTIKNRNVVIQRGNTLTLKGTRLIIRPGREIKAVGKPGNSVRQWSLFVSRIRDSSVSGKLLEFQTQEISPFRCVCVSDPYCPIVSYLGSPGTDLSVISLGTFTFLDFSCGGLRLKPK